MLPEQKYLITIEEVTNSRSQYLSGMNHWLELIIPEYGDIIVWYPMQPEHQDTSTSTLAEQLHRFGELLNYVCGSTGSRESA
jgi:hypothetical protein